MAMGTRKGKEATGLKDIDSWNEWEVDVLTILKKNSVKKELIAKVLNRSTNSIQAKSSRMGLKADFFQNFDDDQYVEEQLRFNQLDKKVVGTINEDLVKIKLSFEGFEVYTSFMDNHKTDIVILHHGIPIRVQVKSAGYDQSIKGFRSHLYTKDKNGNRIEYKHADVNFFIVKCNGIEEYYVIPYIAGKSTSSIRLYPHRHKVQNKRDFEIYRNAFHLIREYEV